MVNLKSILVVLLLLCQSLAFGSDKRLALVRRIQGLEQIPQSLGHQLERLTMLVISKQADYELLLSGTDTPIASVVDMVAVESEVGRTNDGYRIEARLLDIRTKKLLTKASHSNIREEDLVRMFQGALESLFIPDAKIKPIAPDKVSNPKTTIIPRQKMILPSTTQMKEPDAPTLDFKKIVRDLKRKVDKEIEKKVELKTQAEQKEADKKKADQASQTASIAKGEISKKVTDEKRPSLKSYPRRLNIFAGWDSRSIDSTYLVDTSVKAQLLTLKSDGHIPLDILQGRMAASYNLSLSRALSIPIEAPALYQVGLFGTWLEPRWNISAGINRDASFFVNLPSPGEGLAASSITAAWITVNSEVNFDFWGQWFLGAKFGVPGMVETNYAPLKKAKQWQGNNLQLTMTPPLYFKGWSSSFSFQQINLSSQGEAPFTLNESRIALFVRRSL